MSGNFVKKEDGLLFNEDIITTKKACEDYNEKTFLDNLIRTNGFKIESGVLMLMYNETILSKWARQVKIKPLKRHKVSYSLKILKAFLHCRLHRNNSRYLKFIRD